MAAVRAAVERAYARAATPRPRVLSVIHEGRGGTWIANLELLRALEAEWEPFLLTSDRRTLRLWRVKDGDLEQVEEWTLERAIRATDFSRADYASIVRALLARREIELVHVRHLFKHTFDAPRVAAELGIGVVFSFHDFYFTCPTVHLLDDHDVYCAAQCTPGDGVCRIPDAGLEGLPHLKHSYVYQWREEAETMLRDVDAFVTTSAHARNVHLRALPSLVGRRFELIEHGRALRQESGVARAPAPSGPIRILIVANLDVHKGAAYIRALRAADRESRLEFHLLGNVPEESSDLGFCHGTFQPGELPSLARRIAPAFAGCLSVAAETYSHWLTEAWGLGLPVIATDIGALGERVRAHGGGQLIPLGDAEEAIRRIYSAAEPDAYTALQAEASLRGCASVVDMADAYAALYRHVLDSRRALPADPDGPIHLRSGIVRMLAVVPGSEGGVHPGSTYVRVIQRYRHPSVADKLSLSVRQRAEDALGRPADVVLVQRTALDPGAAQDFIAAARDRNLPLVLDLDDHLLAKPVDDPDYGHHRAALEALLEAAELVVVSTHALADALGGTARNVAVVPNLIDERLFLGGVEDPPSAGAPRGGRPTQIVYVGSPTHARDLTLLRPVMQELGARYPGAFELNVVGVEPPGPDQDWYRRIVVPNECKPYPSFVRWLRDQRGGWDLAVAPLRDDAFNRYKSDLKFLEYAALGLPAVYSDRQPYATVTDRQTGLKVGDSVEEWVAALRALADDESLADALAREAFHEVTSSRLLRHGAEDLLVMISGVLGGSAEPSTAGDEGSRSPAYDRAL
jgi:glycosyltransferase involved in cell wall biosynthesis